MHNPLDTTCPWPIGEGAVTAAAVHGGVVADAHQCLSYSDLAAAVARFECWLEAEAGLEADRCLSLSVGNDLPSLVALLGILRRRRSCALLPPHYTADCPPAFSARVLIPARMPANDHEGPACELRDLPDRTPARVEPGWVYLRTSGSTGQPRWVVHGADALLGNAHACIERLQITPGDRVLIPVPLHHMYGLAAALLPSLQVGASVDLVPRGNPLEIFQHERNSDPTIAFLVPSQCRSLLAMRRSRRIYRCLVVAGDRLNPDEFSRFEATHGTVVALYGTTELGAVAAGTPDAPVEIRRACVGTLLPGIQSCAGGLVTTAADAPADLCFRHPWGFLGYADALGRIGTAAPPCYCTRDLGSYDSAGRLRVIGRSDHAVKRDGLLVHFAEVEDCLLQAGSLSGAAVVPAGQTRRGVRLIAFCAPARGCSWTPETLRRHCLAVLPLRAVPDHIVFVPALPLLNSGKLNRHALENRAVQMVSQTTDYEGTDGTANR